MNTANRRADGQPETPADTRFFDLRAAGFRGSIDQDGYPVSNPGPVDDTRQDNAHRAGAFNHLDGSGETPMIGKEIPAAGASPRITPGLFALVDKSDARELKIADTELRHVVNVLVACLEENAVLRAELDMERQERTERGVGRSARVGSGG